MQKSRCRIVLKKIEQKMTTLKKTVIAACILHNICIEKGDPYDTEDSDSEDSSDDDSGRRNAFETGSNIRHLKRPCVGKPVNKVVTEQLYSLKALICLSVVSNTWQSKNKGFLISIVVRKLFDKYYIYHYIKSNEKNQYLWDWTEI